MATAYTRNVVTIGALKLNIFSSPARFMAHRARPEARLGARSTLAGKCTDLIRHAVAATSAPVSNGLSVTQPRATPHKVQLSLHRRNELAEPLA
ncbi:hypothetical protein [Streptomyces sp. NPDC055299]